MSDPDPKPLSPAFMAGIFFFFQLAGLVFVSMTGGFAKMPPALQFFFGIEAVAVPMIVYIFLKRRRDRGE